jgi:hypothetical protein
MAVSFTRRFLFDPGSNILLNIESVNVLDLQPPGQVVGVGTGVACMVGEFEDGPFNFPYQVVSPNDLASTFGTLGYTYGGVQGLNPCAIARKADGALTPEFWNGNGFVQLNAKQFSALVLARANTSIGNVTFTPQAFITGASAFRYNLTPSGSSIALDLGPTGTYSTATFTGTAGTVTGSGAAFGSITAGMSVVLQYDSAASFTTFFQTGDTTVAAVVARINQYAGFAFAAAAGGQLQLTGLQLGNGGQVQVVSGSAGTLTDLGLTVGTTTGTGNVNNLTAVTPQEVATVIQAAVSGSKVEVDALGRLRISNTTTPSTGTILVGTVTATALGFTAGQAGNASPAASVIGAPVATLPAGTLTLSVDGSAPFNITITSAEALSAVITAINSAAGFTFAYGDVGVTVLRLIGRLQNGSGSITISASSGALLVALGLTAGTTAAPLFQAGSIPAGTVVQVPATTAQYVTMQSIYFTSGGVFLGATSVAAGGTPLAINGPWAVPVRPALDDGTQSGASATTVTQVSTPPLGWSLSCINLFSLSNALTESQIDAAYVTSLASTLNMSTVAKTINMIWSARQSNTVRTQLGANADTASASGLSGRIAVIRTPLGTTEAAATSINAQPGVGAYRDQRVVYCWPQARTYVPLIAQLGTAGNPQGTTYTAFTPDGNVDVGADGFLISIMSQLPPEENPGQLTPFSGGIVSLESSPNAQGLMLSDYIVLKAAGICALRYDTDDATAIFQSGVTSVNPVVNPGLVRISRRRMADYIQDSLANAMSAFGKKLSTQARRKSIVGEINNFLYGLLSKENPANQRIGGYTVDPTTGNTQTTLAQGMFRVIINVRTLPSLDSIVLQTTVGENVQVQEVLPLAA